MENKKTSGNASTKEKKYYVVDGIRYSEEEYRLVFGRESK